ncbi:MAG: YggS family pyridoxal phosphate-dependent enzyme [Clostridia bacterium]|nr:YggS family pyridoxal phosphate-dependent enzyme [Clostridia bacterium]
MIKENLEKIINEIKDGNNLGEKITLVGATKTVPVSDINFAVLNGLKVVAENKVQEFREKTDLIVGAEQQFIGHLQTNKAKYLVGKVSLIHSVDTFRLAEEISRLAVIRNVIQNVLIEINVGEEESKSGFNYDEAEKVIDTISSLPNVKVCGFMAMLPPSDDEKYLSFLFTKMRKLYDKLIDKYSLIYLSMGMSGDYKIAIKNGSNMIRLGTALFGKRNYEVK